MDLSQSCGCYHAFEAWLVRIGLERTLVAANFQNLPRDHADDGVIVVVSIVLSARLPPLVLNRIVVRYLLLLIIPAVHVPRELSPAVLRCVALSTDLRNSQVSQLIAFTLVQAAPRKDLSVRRCRIGARSGRDLDYLSLALRRATLL